MIEGRKRHTVILFIKVLRKINIRRDKHDNEIIKTKIVTIS